MKIDITMSDTYPHVLSHKRYYDIGKEEETDDDSKGAGNIRALRLAMIIGISCGVLLIIGIIVFCVCRKKKVGNEEGVTELKDNEAQ